MNSFYREVGFLLSLYRNSDKCKDVPSTHISSDNIISLQMWATRTSHSTALVGKIFLSMEARHLWYHTLPDIHLCRRRVWAQAIMNKYYKITIFLLQFYISTSYTIHTPSFSLLTTWWRFLSCFKKKFTLQQCCSLGSPSCPKTGRQVIEVLSSHSHYVN